MLVFTRVKVEGHTKRHDNFLTTLGLPEDNNTRSCIRMINNLSLFKVPLHLLLYPRWAELQERYRVSYCNNPKQDFIANLPNLQKVRPDGATQCWTTCHGLLEPSTGRAESLQAPPSAIRVLLVWYQYSSVASECLASEWLFGDLESSLCRMWLPSTQSQVPSNLLQK
jgi:hypothetical protein